MEVKKSTNKKIVRLNKKNIKCPTCKKISQYPFTPFCSKKCSDIDLMKWLSEENYIDLNIE